MAREACVKRTLVIYCYRAADLIWQAHWLLLLLTEAGTARAAGQAPVPSSVSVGSYLPPSISNPVGLASPDGIFNLRIEAWEDSPARYCMAAVVNVKIGSGNPMLWAAHNGQPLSVDSSSNCNLFLSPQGDLLLQHDGNNTAWRTHTAGLGVSNLTLHNSGNLVLYTKKGLIVWQSFTQSPAFAWNSGMNLTSNINIIYSSDPFNGDTNFVVPGSFALQLHNSSLVLLSNSNDSSSRFVYWSISLTNSSHSQHANTLEQQVSYVALADDGFTFYDNSSQALGSIAPTVSPPPSSSSALRVALLDPTSGNLQAYYRVPHSWNLFYNSSIRACVKPTQCGDFGLCNASSTPANCTCPPGFLRNSAQGCMPELDISFPPISCSSTSVTSLEASSYRFVSVNVSFPPQLFPISSPSVKNCTSLCIHSCVCRVALFDSGASSCSLFSNLPTLPLSTESKQLMLLKFIAERHDSSKKRLASILGAVCAAVAASLCMICSIAAICRTKRKGNRNSSSTGPPKEEVFLQELPRLPPRYTYKELEEATKNFSTMLGAGGFGGVFEGVLQSGVKVAVKKLEVSGVQSSVQFRAEVASIGSVSHVNLLKLKGFCQEGDWRLLVYEHMGRGSLDKWLFREGELEEGKELGWQRRCNIALNTAMGLAYLHHECGERIVHCDVKPENILLDEDFNAKVGDFGLAKLVGHGRQGFTLTTIKGTRGYMAPEWLQDATITTKSDVYSFGIVLLELISGRRCLNSDLSYLPTLAFRIYSLSLARSNRLRQQSHSEVMIASPAPPGFEDKESFLSHSSTSDDTITGRKKSVQNDVSQQALMIPYDASVPKPITSSHPSYDQHDNDNGFDMAALLDPRLSTDADVSATSLERMIFIALWCLQPSPAGRPSMSAVVQMMEGVADVPPPPLQNPPLYAFGGTPTSSSDALISTSSR